MKLITSILSIQILFWTIAPTFSKSISTSVEKIACKRSCYSAEPDNKSLLIGKWTITKVEGSPEVQKDYNDWKQKFNDSKDKNEKEILKTNIEAYESVLESFNGMCTEFKKDGSCTVEVPNFSATEPKLLIKGKWQLSADNKTITVTMKDKKPEYEIVTLTEKEFIYKVGKGPGMRTFHLTKI